MRSNEWMTHDEFREKLAKEESGRQSCVEIPKYWIACIVSSGLMQRGHTAQLAGPVSTLTSSQGTGCAGSLIWEDTELVLSKFRVWKEMDGAWGLELGSSLGAVWSLISGQCWGWLRLWAVWSLTGGQCWGWPHLWAVWSLIIST